MKFILAELKYIEEMCRITQEAKEQLKRLGLDQWQKGYPSREIWLEDIENKMTWLAMDDDGEKVLGAFAYQVTPDVSYGEIDGAWLTDGPYASMHRVCVSDDSKGRGVAGAMFAHGFSMAKEQGFVSARIDTHPGNLPMQKALKKAGFVFCGRIILKGGSEAGDERLAYEKVLQSSETEEGRGR